MTATRVHFTSSVDTKGYKIVPARRPPRGTDLLASTSRDWAEARIVGMGGGLRAVRLSSYPLLFNKFASVKTPEQLLAFITEYGPLTYGRNAPRKGGDEIPPLLDEAASMGACFKSRGRHSLLTADLKASLSIKKGNVSVNITPVRLLDALWLQLGQALAECSEWKKCLHCGDWFPVGGKSGRRLDAKFCRDEHRIEYNSLARSR